MKVFVRAVLAFCLLTALILLDECHSEPTPDEALGWCGDGLRRNGTCKNPNYCCSAYGYCGDLIAWCGPQGGVSVNNPPSPSPSPTPITQSIPNVIQPTPAVQPVSGTPASAFGPTDYCGGGERRNGRCQNPDHCCSAYYWCGPKPDFCVPVTPDPKVGGGGKGVASFLTEADFNAIFPQRNAQLYTYDSFIKACDTFAAFGTTGSIEDQKREVAAFLAHVDHESVHLTATVEHDCMVPAYLAKCRSDYNAACDKYRCHPDKIYFGRGPIQLSHPFNYYDASTEIFGDGDRLLQDPDLVITDGSVAFGSALWFWMRKGCHGAFLSKGFGVTTKIVNGAYECPPGPSDLRQQSRVKNFKEFSARLGVSPGAGELFCSSATTI